MTFSLIIGEKIKELYCMSASLSNSDQVIGTIDISPYRTLLFLAIAESAGTFKFTPRVPYFKVYLSGQYYYSSDNPEYNSVPINVRTNIQRVTEGSLIYAEYSPIPKIVNAVGLKKAVVVLPAGDVSAYWSGSAKLYVASISDPANADYPIEKKVALLTDRFYSLESGNTYSVSAIDVSDISRIQVALEAQSPVDSSGFTVAVRGYYNKPTNVSSGYALFYYTPSGVADYYTEVLNQTTNTIIDTTNPIDVSTFNYIDVLVTNGTAGDSNISVVVTGELL